MENQFVGFSIGNRQDALNSGKKWFPYNKGGGFKKWYGNNEYLINWENDGLELRNFKGSVIRSPQFYFRKCLSWCKVTISGFSMRLIPEGFLFDVAGCSLFVDDKKLPYLLGFANSKVNTLILSIISPTVNYEVGHIASLPIKEISDSSNIIKIVNENIIISKNDWDFFEISWDFKTHPLVKLRMAGAYAWGDALPTCRISSAFKAWVILIDGQYDKLKSNEEELNRIFIEIYGLQKELNPEVEDKEVTIRKADLERDIRSFISYAVGCIFGRYSLDLDGLVYAGGKWDVSKYKTFNPDKDNIIPITDEEYFDDDIVARFVNFVKVVYGDNLVEENLDFIADALGNKGSTTREVIRNYFIKDFYNDHVKNFKKRPIYWLFDSGKQNGFKALIYLHRYNEDTVGRVRADYLHKTQTAIENAIASCDVVFESNASASDKAKAVKQKGKLVKQLAETRIYDQAIAHIAHQRISIDLDDGVVANYAKFQGIEVASEGKKSVKVNLLGKI